VKDLEGKESKIIEKEVDKIVATYNAMSITERQKFLEENLREAWFVFIHTAKYLMRKCDKTLASRFVRKTLMNIALSKVAETKDMKTVVNDIGNCAFVISALATTLEEVYNRMTVLASLFRLQRMLEELKEDT